MWIVVVACLLLCTPTTAGLQRDSNTRIGEEAFWSWYSRQVLPSSIDSSARNMQSCLLAFGNQRIEDRSKGVVEQG